MSLFWLFLHVIEKWTASAAAYVLALMPVVAVTLAALIADEPITIQLVAGGLLLIAAATADTIPRQQE